MREALARTDHDFVISEPVRRRKAAPQRKVLGFMGAVARFVCHVAAYPNRVAGALVVSLTLAILVNALMLQHSRHPAPLFHKTIHLQVQAHAEKPAVPAATHEPHRTWHDPIGQWIGARLAGLRGHGSVEKTKPESRRHAHEEAKAETRNVTHDSIGQMLRSNASHDSHEKTLDERPQTVLAVQHALVKLGFVVRPDGHMGAVTRHALEQFERNHGMPQEGRLTPALLRRLSADSGLTID